MNVQKMNLSWKILSENSAHLESISEIEFPCQLLQVKKGEKVNTSKLFYHIMNSSSLKNLGSLAIYSNPNSLDELCIYNNGGRVITLCKDKSGVIYKRSYEVLNPIEVLMGSKTFSKFQFKYYIYKRRLKE